MAPPIAELSLEGVALHIAPPADGIRLRHTIDAFLRTVARSGGSMAIGVVLSGTGTDGTLGLKAIMDEGGITFAQEPSTASQPGMPQSAIDAGCADFSLTPAEIGDELMRLAKHPYVGRARPIQLADPNALSKIFAQLRTAYGVDFTQYKPSTVERRIGRRMALHKIDAFDDYLSLLAADSVERRSLYNDLLIGVTAFFRDSEPFDALKSVVFPRLFANRGADTPIRVWVAGCATGEEAYSTAIVLLEFLGDRARNYKIQISRPTSTKTPSGVRASAPICPTSSSTSRRSGCSVSSRERRRATRFARAVRDLVVFARHNLGKIRPSGVSTSSRAGTSSFTCSCPCRRRCPASSTMR